MHYAKLVTSRTQSLVLGRKAGCLHKVFKLSLNEHYNDGDSFVSSLVLHPDYERVTMDKVVSNGFRERDYYLMM